MRLFNCFVIAVFLLICDGCGNGSSQEATEEACPSLLEKSLVHDGTDREYLLYLPVGYDPAQSFPLVINMHGYSSNNQEIMTYTNFNTIADSNNVVVVYPQGLVGEVPAFGTNTHWNADYGTGVDDIGFINALLDKLIETYAIDKQRVYAIGMSNGGYMSYTLACELAGRIAAVASVTGSMSAHQLLSCIPDRAVPILQVHGTNDTSVPYYSPKGFAVLDVIDFWVANNRCDTANVTIAPLPDLDTADATTVELITYSAGENGSEVLFYTVDGGGHTWPGAVPVPSLGATNQDFSASEVIWNFLSKHVHPSPE